MDNSQVFDIPINAPLEASIEHAMVPASRPTFAYNPQSPVSGLLHNSVKYEDNGIFCGKYNYKYRVAYTFFIQDKAVTTGITVPANPNTNTGTVLVSLDGGTFDANQPTIEKINRNFYDYEGKRYAIDVSYPDSPVLNNLGFVWGFLKNNDYILPDGVYKDISITRNNYNTATYKDAYRVSGHTNLYGLPVNLGIDVYGRYMYDYNTTDHPTFNIPVGYSAATTFTRDKISVEVVQDTLSQDNMVLVMPKIILNETPYDMEEMGFRYDDDPGGTLFTHHTYIDCSTDTSYREIRLSRLNTDLYNIQFYGDLDMLLIGDKTVENVGTVSEVVKLGVRNDAVITGDFAGRPAPNDLPPGFILDMDLQQAFVTIAPVSSTRPIYGISLSAQMADRSDGINITVKPYGSQTGGRPIGTFPSGWVGQGYGTNPHFGLAIDIGDPAITGSTGELGSLNGSEFISHYTAMTYSPTYRSISESWPLDWHHEDQLDRRPDGPLRILSSDKGYGVIPGSGPVLVSPLGVVIALLLPNGFDFTYGGIGGNTTPPQDATILREQGLDVATGSIWASIVNELTAYYQTLSLQQWWTMTGREGTQTFGVQVGLPQVIIQQHNFGGTSGQWQQIVGGRACRQIWIGMSVTLVYSYEVTNAVDGTARLVGRCNDVETGSWDVVVARMSGERNVRVKRVEMDEGLLQGTIVLALGINAANTDGLSPRIQGTKVIDSPRKDQEVGITFSYQVISVYYFENIRFRQSGKDILIVKQGEQEITYKVRLQEWNFTDTLEKTDNPAQHFQKVYVDVIGQSNTELTKYSIDMRLAYNTDGNKLIPDYTYIYNTSSIEWPDMTNSSFALVSGTSMGKVASTGQDVSYQFNFNILRVFQTNGVDQTWNFIFPIITDVTRRRLWLRRMFLFSRNGKLNWHNQDNYSYSLSRADHIVGTDDHVITFHRNFVLDSMTVQEKEDIIIMYNNGEFWYPQYNPLNHSILNRTDIELASVNDFYRMIQYADGSYVYPPSDLSPYNENVQQVEQEAIILINNIQIPTYDAEGNELPIPFEVVAVLQNILNMMFNGIPRVVIRDVINNDLSDKYRILVNNGISINYNYNSDMLRIINSSQYGDVYRLTFRGADKVQFDFLPIGIYQRNNTDIQYVSCTTNIVNGKVVAEVSFRYRKRNATAYTTAMVRVYEEQYPTAPGFSDTIPITEGKAYIELEAHDIETGEMQKLDVANPDIDWAVVPQIMDTNINTENMYYIDEDHILKVTSTEFILLERKTIV